MQAINAAMETLIRALKESDQTRANQAALQIASLSKSIDPNKDHRSDYGKDFAGLVKDLQQAATAMTQAVADNSKAPQALRHLHDQCLRCHDQAPAAASVSVCQLTQ